MKPTQSRLTRRALISGATALATGTLTAAQGLSKDAAGAAKVADQQADLTVRLREGNAVVETSAGNVWGFTRNGIQSFKGIPYGATTEGNARYLPPAKPVPWSDTRAAMWWGKICPQVPVSHAVNELSAILWERVEGQPTEDCLNLNVWTPALDNRKRPVMVWLHGGGFQTGSSFESPTYHGENLARRGDVVVVSVNHRLGILGFLDLSAFGAQYELSANLGLLDLVAALEWVSDNIANFGGDQGNVTIFGQSGGGGKVTALMSMPAAKGLFHKAIVQSGAMLMANSRDQAAELTAAVLSELNLKPAEIALIHELPANRLVEAGTVARRKVSPPNIPGPQLNRTRQVWGPNLNEKVLPWAPYDPACLHLSAGIPLMVGTTRDEISSVLLNYETRLMTEEQLKGYFTRAFDSQAEAIATACRKLYPNSRVSEVASTVSAIVMQRRSAVEMADRKVGADKAPAFYYQFNWKSPILDGLPGAYHCLELPFVFYNTGVEALETGGGPQVLALAEQISDAWLNFARHGNPNHSGLPQWPYYSAPLRPTMIFDNECSIKNDYEEELRQLIVAATEKQTD